MRTRRLAPGGTSPRRIRPAVFTPVAVLLAALGYGPLIGQETGGRAFTFDDAIDLVRVSGPKFAPDGARVLFVRNELDWEKNKRVSRIWVVGADGQNARPFTGSPDEVIS